VIRVSSGGPGEQAGVQPGDLILAVNDKAISGLADFYRKMWALGGAGVDVHLSIRRGALVREITVHSTDRYEFLWVSPRTLMWTSHGTNEIGSLTMSSPGMATEEPPWWPIIIPVEPGLPLGRWQRSSVSPHSRSAFLSAFQSIYCVFSTWLRFKVSAINRRSGFTQGTYD
jgi:hypothetical protein